MRRFVFVSAFVMIGVASMYYVVGNVVAILAVVCWFYRVIIGYGGVCIPSHSAMTYVC